MNSDQHHHRRTDDKPPDQIYDPESGAISFRWTGKLVLIVTLIASGIGAVATREIGLIMQNQQQDYRISDMERRVAVLEQIAKTNSEARIELKTNQEYMLNELKIISSTLTQHEAETKPPREKR